MIDGFLLWVKDTGPRQPDSARECVELCQARQIRAI